MALQVGELNGIITIDDRAVNPALRRAEQALRRAGSAMGDDAERAGQQAGDALGGGFVRGADGQWRNMRAELVDAVTAAALEAEREAHQAGRRIADGVGDGLNGLRADAARAGRQAGDALGDGLADGADEGTASATENMGSRLEKFKGMAAGGGAAAGAAVGAYLIDAFGQVMDQGQITAKMNAQLGATGPLAAQYGKAAGALFKDAVVEDFQAGADTIKAIASAGLVPPGATNAQIKSIATNAADLANTMEVDVGEAANAAGSMVKNGLAKNGKQAFDLLIEGSKGLGAAGEDMLETFTEYGPVFKSAGLSGKTAMGLIRQAVQGGWAKDTDKIGDAFKELSLRAVDGSKTTADAMKSIGLNATQVGADIAAGGARGEKAMGQVLDSIRKVGPKSTTAKQAVQNLFGGAGEDLGAALFSLNVGKASKSMDHAAGSADKFGNAMRDNAATKITKFKNTVQQSVVEFLGGPVLGSLDKVKGAVGGIWDDAGKGGDKGVDRVMGFVQILGQRLVTKIKELAPKAVEGLIGLGQKIADYVTANPEQVFKIAAIVGAFAVVIANLPAIMAGLLATAAYLIIGGFIDNLIKATNEKIDSWWATFTTWVSTKASSAGTVMAVLGVALAHWFSGLWSQYIAGPVSRTWNSFISGVRALPSRASIALASLAVTLANRASNAWSAFKVAAAKKAVEFVAWVHGLPGRISSSMGSLSGLLVQKGKNVVQGLWAGIQSMGGWIRGRLMSWAKSAIPAPIAKALGINSPSKVTKAQGRWIARGLIDGLTGSTKQVKSAATKLADVVRDGMAPGRKRSKALGVIASGSKKLQKLASQEAKLAEKMKAATKKVADQIKARDALAADVKKGVLESGNITKQDTGGWPQTAESILAGLKQDTAAAQLFAKNLATLRKKGVRADLIAQIAQAGVDQGSSAAAALANANSSQVKQINSQQKALVSAAGKAGTTAGDAMYGAGIHAAQGLVKGLKSQQKQIEKQMLSIAKGMSKAIKKALGIKSPSRVMALVGEYTAQGLIKGVDSQRSAVNSSMASLVDTPAPGSWDNATARARAAASQRVVLEFRSPERGVDKFVMESMRRGVRKKGGGDVDLVLAGRRSI